MAARARDELGQEIRRWWAQDKGQALKLPPMRKFWRFIDWERWEIMKELPNLTDLDGSGNRTVNTILARSVPDFVSWLAVWDNFSALSPLETPDVVVTTRGL